MMELPKNRILKGLVYATTVAVVLCYAWLTARLLEPTFAPPPSVAVSVFARTGENIEFFEDIARSHAVETLRLEEELNWAASKFQLLGALNPSLRVVVSFDKPERLIVTADRIEIGQAVLRAKGQLKKALLKAWFLQKASAEMSASFLRLEVASDFLLAVLDGGLNLEVPGQTHVLTYTDEVQAWWSYAETHHGLCGSAWRSLELQTLCAASQDDSEAVSISNLSFRPFLGQQLWQSYLATAPSGRESFVRRWLTAIASENRDVNLKEEDGSTSAMTVSASEDSHDWPLRLRDEMDTLLSVDLDPRKDERSKWDRKLDVPLIVIDPSGRITAPGTLKVAADEIPIRKAKLAFVTSCEAPTLKALTSIPVETARVVWKPECAKRQTDFVQVRPSSVALALRRGLAKPSDRLDEFVKTAAKESRDLLGLREARWDKAQKAFVVKGAIEAIEAFRLGSGV